MKKYMGIGAIVSAVLTSWRMFKYRDYLDLKWDEAESWYGTIGGYLLGVVLWPVSIVSEIYHTIKWCFE